MPRIFDNGRLPARAKAWLAWLLLAFGCSVAWHQMGAEALGRRWVVGVVFIAGSVGLLVQTKPPRIPVLNYHSVSADPSWLGIPERLSLSPQAFERQLRYLRRRGYRAVFLSELRPYLKGERRLHRGERMVALTFDDGYADNWMAAAPLLRQFEMKATVFVTTDFIEERSHLRRTIEGLPKTAWAALDWSGFLSWAELQAMVSEGLVEVQSHGRTHARAFTGPSLKGFVGPGCPPRWWRGVQPSNRWRSRSDEEDRAWWGHPIFPEAPALAVRAYRPDPKLVAHMLAWAKEQGPAFFERADWANLLRREWRRVQGSTGSAGTWETAEEYEARVEAELAEARRVLRERLGVEAEILCWPENAFSAAGEKVAQRVGYAATVSNRHRTLNMVGGGDGTRVRRVFIGSRAAGIASDTLDFLAFVLELKVFEGWYVVYPVLALFHQLRKVMLFARSLRSCRTAEWSLWG